MVKLSVLVTTYNHANYIAQCLDSILMQQTTFPFEIILGEDESTDGTREICKDYAQKHPDIIKLFLRSRKDVIYINGKPTGRFNFLASLKACTGKYIALCEGDDFWTDPLKLQKQVDFLEANPEYEACFTNISIIDEKGREVKNKMMKDNRRTVYSHAHMPIWAPTLTRVFRNRDFSKLYSEAPGFDTYMMVYQSKFGKVKLLNEVMGTYRLHQGSIYSSKSYLARREQHLQNMMACLDIVEPYLRPKFLGIAFKKLVEIHTLDHNLFAAYHKQLKVKYKAFKTQFSPTLRFKIAGYFVMLSLRPCMRLARYRTFLRKAITRGLKPKINKPEQ